MCGICGFTGEVLDRDEVIKRMTDVITHRGPDSSGVFAGDGVTMGFRRLSIIDVGNTGDQPIYNEDRTLVLTFNGEIYNYQDLRKELLEKGHKFYTNTDSEVLVHGFEEWKEGLLNRLRGMFGFAIWNTVDNSLFLARDYFGIKPLHYTQVGDSFVYGSEIKSILEFPGFQKKFNRHALDNYISFEYAPPPETFFENVFCLMPAHYLWYKDGKVTTTRYWEPKFDADESMTEEQAVDAIEKVFEESVAAHKISDVEVGCFLSSGVDSSYVSTYFKGQKTFTVGFDYGEKYNEIDWAKGLSKEVGLEHHYKVISTEEYWDSIRKVQYHMDQPLADASCIALYFVSKIASEYVKVVLSGEGADELFGGYNIYHEPDDLAGYKKLPLFLRKYNAKGLLQYAKRERVHKGHGDIIVCLDESASTEGENAEWGKALALAVQDICSHEGRKFALIHFSGADQLRTDLFLPGQYTADDLLSAAEHFFDGGTDFEAPIREALRLINEEAFENADILFITDGESSISDELSEQLQDAIQDARCAVVGLLLDADSPGMAFSLKKFCEKIIRISEIDKESVEKILLEC